jgi:outer membrane protein TolC
MRRSWLALPIAVVLGATARTHAQGPLTPVSPGAPAAPAAAAPVAAPGAAAGSSPPGAPIPTPTVALPAPPAGTVNVAGDPTLASKVEVKPKPSVFTLARCLQLADERAPQIKMAVDRWEASRAQLDEVKWSPWSSFSLTGGVAIVPQIRGTNVYSPNYDVPISSTLGPAFRVGVDGYVPLYTFGKLEHSVGASKALLQVALADVQRARNVVRHDVRRAFFGLQLAHDGRYLLEFARSKLADAVRKAEGDDDVDEPDLLRMKTYQMEINARLGEVDKAERMALAALRFFSGVEAPAAFDIPEEPIAPPKKPLVDVLVYLNAAKLHRPEAKQVKANVEARTHQLEVAKARLYPDVGVSAYFGFANSPMITDQTNPFVVDNANFLRFTLGLSVKWSLDVLPGSARIRAAEAQLAEMRAQETLTLGNVGVEVQSAWATARDAQTREKYFGEAEALAKKWTAAVSASIAIGTRDDRDIIDPLRSYLTNRYSHLMAIMDLDVAYSQLALATGDESFAEF